MSTLRAPKEFVEVGKVRPGGSVEASHEYLRFFDALVRSVTSNILSGDLVIDLATAGLVLKDTQSPAHYWRLGVNTSGALVTTDLGTTRP